MEVGAFALKVDAPDAPLGADVSLSLRPEKIRLVAPQSGQLEGTVHERFFLGSQWLYRVTTPLGELLVVCSNDGGAPVEEGAAVGLDWSDAMVRVLPGALVS